MSRGMKVVAYTLVAMVAAFSIILAAAYGPTEVQVALMITGILSVLIIIIVDEVVKE